MPNKTPNLGLNIWLENDIVDFDEINENFTKLDNIPVCTESGTATATYTYGTTGSATWRYKKYADGTIEMSAALQYTNLRCNQGDAAPYYSGESLVSFPFQLSSVYDVQMHQASNTRCWVVNTTNNTIPATLSNGTSGLKFILMNMWAETNASEQIYRQVFVSVKGVLAET